MPDQQGTLSEPEKQKIITWLNGRAKNHLCPVCLTNDWTVADHLINGMPYTGGGLILGGPTYPQAILICNNCAYTRNFMAIPMGILPRDPPSEPKKERKKEASDGG